MQVLADNTKSIEYIMKVKLAAHNVPTGMLKPGFFSSPVGGKIIKKYFRKDSIEILLKYILL